MKRYKKIASLFTCYLPYAFALTACNDSEARRVYFSAEF